MKTKFLYLNETQLKLIEDMIKRSIENNLDMNNDPYLGDFIELVDILKMVREQNAKS